MGDAMAVHSQRLLESAVTAFFARTPAGRSVFPTSIFDRRTLLAQKKCFSSCVARLYLLSWSGGSRTSYPLLFPEQMLHTPPRLLNEMAAQMDELSLKKESVDTASQNVPIS